MEDILLPVEDYATYSFLSVPTISMDFFLERNKNVNIVLVREEYERIFDQLVEPMLRGELPEHQVENGKLHHLCCSGIPGIGKSVFQVYVIWRILQRLQTDPGQCAVKEIYVRGTDHLSPYCIQIYPQVKSSPLDDLDGEEQRLLLIDGRIDDFARNARAHKFLFCSERAKNYEEYKKAMSQCFLSPWSLDELKALHAVFPSRFQDCTFEHLYELYTTWGGVPRTIASPPDLKTVVNQFDLNKVEVFDASVEGNKGVSYTVLHLWPVKMEKRAGDTWITQFASPVIAEHITNRLLIKKKEWIDTCIIDGKDTQNKTVWEAFERIGIDLFWKKMQNNSEYAQWVVRRKYQRGRWKDQVMDRVPTDWGPNEGEKLPYNKLGDLRVLLPLNNRLKKRLFLNPMVPNQETTDGAVYIPPAKGNRPRQRTVMLFQPTTANIHSLKLSGLRKFFEELGESSNELKDYVQKAERIVFILVIPPYQRNCSLHQPEWTKAKACDATSKHAVEKNILAKLEVYVVRITKEGVKAVGV